MAVIKPETNQADNVSAAAKPRQSLFQRYALPLGVALFLAALGFAALFSYARMQNRDTVNSTLANCPVAQCISLFSDAAVPNTITLTAGSFVQFNAADGKRHNISLAHSAAQHDDPTEYESGDFESDEAWKVQFKKDGTYTFRDKYNDKINVSVIVYTPGKDYSIE